MAPSSVSHGGLTGEAAPPVAPGRRGPSTGAGAGGDAVPAAAPGNRIRPWTPSELCSGSRGPNGLCRCLSRTRPSASSRGRTSVDGSRLAWCRIKPPTPLDEVCAGAVIGVAHCLADSASLPGTPSTSPLQALTTSLSCPASSRRSAAPMPGELFRALSMRLLVHPLRVSVKPERPGDSWPPPPRASSHHESSSATDVPLAEPRPHEMAEYAFPESGLPGQCDPRPAACVAASAAASGGHGAKGVPMQIVSRGDGAPERCSKRGKVARRLLGDHDRAWPPKRPPGSGPAKARGVLG